MQLCRIKKLCLELELICGNKRSNIMEDSKNVCLQQYNQYNFDIACSKTKCVTSKNVQLKLTDAHLAFDHTI